MSRRKTPPKRLGRLISKRTKALAAAKRRSAKFRGNWRALPSARMRAKATAAIKRQADARAANVAPKIAALQAKGRVTLRAIADGLTAKGIPTARGKETWSAVQVQRVLARL